MATMSEQQASSKGVVAHGEPEMKGWLFKWTNYLKGYQRRWFVLQNGLLSYYRVESSGGPKLSIRRKRRNRRPGNQAEMAHTCRGNISLQGALIHTVDSCTFVISNGGTHTFHIKATNEVDRQSWVTALELAKAKAIRTMELEEDEEEPADDCKTLEELKQVIRELTVRLDDIKTCADLVERHKAALQRVLADLENLHGCDKTFNEKATVFRVASTAMVNSCVEYLNLASTHGTKWIRMLQHEREQRERLQDMLEQLARQHSQLEKVASAHATGTAGGPVGSPSDDDEDNEFYDCDTDGANVNPDDNSFIMNIPVTGAHRRNSSDSSGNDDDVGAGGGGIGGGGIGGVGTSGGGVRETKQFMFVTAGKSGSEDAAPAAAEPAEDTAPAVAASGGEAEQRVQHVRRLKVPDKPNHPLNLWSIMKNCIGKDLSKIPMPVNFSEPLSMLQRLTEDYEYAEVLDEAAKCTDACEQLAYVAAFTVSSYSTTANRTGKPFNPLLGETFECDRTDDLGWRAVSEQVSHHPPVVAQYCEGAGWRCWQEFTMTSKFRGKYLQVIPMGTAHVEFPASGNRYSWRKVTTTVHNIIVGKLWVDHHGDMEIVGQAGAAAGLACHLKYVPYSYFTRDAQRRVTGCVMDAAKTARWTVQGTWDHRVDVAPVTGAPADQVLQTGTAKAAWRRRAPPADCDRYYGFTVLAAQLNEPEPGVAPTDSRLRPDQRLMEDGRWDQANREKLRLEEKQRAVRRARELEAQEALRQGRPYPAFEPVWFSRRKDDDSDVISHVYRGTYWDCKLRQDWAQCPDIF